MKSLKIAAYSIVVLFFVWLNYAFYKANRADKPRLFKPTEEKMKEFIPNTPIKKPDFSLTDDNKLGENPKLEDQKAPATSKPTPQKAPTANTAISSNTTTPSNSATNSSAVNSSKIEAIANLEQKVVAAGLVDVQTVNANILVDLKYSSSDNFLGQDVYGNLQKAYLQAEIAEKLNKAQQFLAEEKPGFSLLVYDAVRPRSVQKQMWDLVKGTAQQRYVASPWGGSSLHNYGTSVDLTIADANGKPLDMGTPFDFFGNQAQPRYETQLLKSGEISQQHIENRKLLRKVMKKAGFSGIQSEWWHFNGLAKEQARNKFKVIE